MLIPLGPPDGKSILFGANQAPYVMNADGSGVRQLTQGLVIGRRNDWSLDGKRITFHRTHVIAKRRFVPLKQSHWLVTGLLRRKEQRRGSQRQQNCVR